MNRAQLRREIDIYYTKNGTQIHQYKKKFQLIWTGNHITNLETIRKFRRLYPKELPTHARRRLHQWGKAKEKKRETQQTNLGNTRNKAGKQKKRSLSQDSNNHESTDQIIKNKKRKQPANKTKTPKSNRNATQNSRTLMNNYTKNGKKKRNKQYKTSSRMAHIHTHAQKAAISK